jgi:hypothetical protein
VTQFPRFISRFSGRLSALIPHGLNQDKRAKLRPFLQPGEKILWAGAPNPNAVFTGSDVFQIPFSLFFFGFSLFWFIGAWTATRGSDESTANAFPFFGIPFMVIGFYMLIGRFFYKRWRNKRTIYAVTDRNIAVLSQSPFGSTLKTVDVASLQELQQEVKGDGRGSIIFGAGDRGFKWFQNSGMDLFGSSRGAPVAFYDIRDARGVHDLIIRQRDELRQAR